MQNFEVTCDTFDMAGNCINGNYAQKWVIWIVRLLIYVFCWPYHTHWRILRKVGIIISSKTFC